MGALKLKIQVENNKVVKSTYSTWYNVIRSLFPKTTATAKITILVSGTHAGDILIEYKDKNNDGTAIHFANNIIGATHKNSDNEDIIKNHYDDLKKYENKIADFTKVEYN